MSIKFNIPLVVGNELQNLDCVIKENKFSGDGEFTKKCNSWLESNCRTGKALMTTSCTHALEMASILIDVQAGDEVIMPSYTFVSTANPFILRGAKIKFVDIRPDTMNIDESKIEQAITIKTKAIVPVHYAGVPCEMDAIMNIAKKYNLYVIEDAAQGLMSTYKNRPIGSIGDIGCLSFHETKNYQCGEGGAILINNKTFAERAEIIREKGTNRKQFIQGVVNKYEWLDLGSSYLISELNAAFLYAQFERAYEVNKKRLLLWSTYYKNLSAIEYIDLQVIPTGIEHNAHMFYIKLRSFNERKSIMEYLESYGIQTAFHYIPLHSSKYCKDYYSFYGRDEYTTKESERLLRLPMYNDLHTNDVNYICSVINKYYYG